MKRDVTKKFVCSIHTIFSPLTAQCVKGASQSKVYFFLCFPWPPKAKIQLVIKTNHLIKHYSSRFLMWAKYFTACFFFSLSLKFTYVRYFLNTVMKIDRCNKLSIAHTPHVKSSTLIWPKTEYKWFAWIKPRILSTSKTSC